MLAPVTRRQAPKGHSGRLSSRRTFALAGLLLFAAVAVLNASAHADRGVGVNLGRIEIDDLLKPGQSYRLPVLGVINTGSEAAGYEVAITYLEDQAELRPAVDWFDLEPRRFFLEPGETRGVDIRLTLPTGADPGDYFGLIEPRPEATGEGARIGIAAATKLSFTVKPSSWLAAQRVRFNRLIDENEPWSYLVPALVLLAGVLFVAHRNFRFGLRVERK